MKVLYLDQTGKLGGGEIALLPWLCHSAPQNVILFEDGPFRALLETCGAEVEVLRMQKLGDVKRESGLLTLLGKVPALLALRSELKQRAAGFDVLYANSQKAFFLAALCKRKHQKLVWHLRDILTAAHFSAPLRRLAVSMGNRYATVVIANSASTAAAFVQAGGDPAKVRTVHDGVDPLPFDSVDAFSIEAVRTELSRHSGALIGVFGRISPWKGQHIFLEALSGLKDAQGVIVGDALFGEENYARQLRERAEQPDLRGRVHFLGFRRDIPTLMRAMDLIVHCSTSAEPFGLVIVEGLLARRPVIATRAGGAMEILRHEEDGLLVAPGSAEELRQACMLLLSQPDTAAAYSASGRRRAEERFSVGRLCQNIEAVLHGL